MKNPVQAPSPFQLKKKGAVLRWAQAWQQNDCCRGTWHGLKFEAHYSPWTKKPRELPVRYGKKIDKPENVLKCSPNHFSFPGGVTFWARAAPTSLYLIRSQATTCIPQGDIQETLDLQNWKGKKKKLLNESSVDGFICNFASQPDRFNSISWKWHRRWK